MRYALVRGDKCHSLTSSQSLQDISATCRGNLLLTPKSWIQLYCDSDWTGLHKVSVKKKLTFIKLLPKLSNIYNQLFSVGKTGKSFMSLAYDLQDTYYVSWIYINWFKIIDNLLYLLEFCLDAVLESAVPLYNDPLWK